MITPQDIARIEQDARHAAYKAACENPEPETRAMAGKDERKADFTAGMLSRLQGKWIA